MSSLNASVDLPAKLSEEATPSRTRKPAELLRSGSYLGRRPGVARYPIVTQARTRDQGNVFRDTLVAPGRLSRAGPIPWQQFNYVLSQGSITCISKFAGGIEHGEHALCKLLKRFILTWVLMSSNEMNCVHSSQLSSRQDPHLLCLHPQCRAPFHPGSYLGSQHCAVRVPREMRPVVSGRVGGCPLKVANNTLHSA